MLDQCADGGSEYFTVMHLPGLLWLVAFQLPGSLDDSGHRHMDVFLLQAVSQGRVVIARDR